jgi:hypothetical protein
MLETAITVTIIVSSAALFAYWFRYACLLILSAKTARDYAPDVAVANGMSFLEVQAALRLAAPVDMDALQASLDRDHAFLRSFGQTNEESQMEDNILWLNYSLARILFNTAGRFSPDVARHSLEEMTTVISHLANAAGERAATSAIT